MKSDTLNDIFWYQFGAAIDMLDNAIEACPDELWQARLFPDSIPEFAEFWCIAYHCLFWLDFYLSETAENFAPPTPFTLSEFESGRLPERVYSKEELRDYLKYGRSKCRTTIQATTDFTAPQQVRPNWRVESVGELHLYNLRHVQEHAAQLSLFLGQNVGTASRWVGKAQD
ncbi:MAG: DinB family protein [Anaerolineales bacterium]|nr:DinB family protein [Anaerolineales bacterium]